MAIEQMNDERDRRGVLLSEILETDDLDNALTDFPPAVAKRFRQFVDLEIGSFEMSIPVTISLNDSVVAKLSATGRDQLQRHIQKTEAEFRRMLPKSDPSYVDSLLQHFRDYWQVSNEGTVTVQLHNLLEVIQERINLTELLPIEWFRKADA